MKVLLISIVMASFFSSMTVQNPLMQLTGKSNPKTKTGSAWQSEETFTYNNLTLYTCSEEPVYFETFTITQDLHGVNNNNVATIQGKGTMEGTGYSLVTGEIFQFKAESWSSGKFSIVGGTIALTSSFKGGFVGEKDSKSLSYVRSHTTITSTGKMIAFDINPTIVCQ